MTDPAAAAHLSSLAAQLNQDKVTPGLLGFVVFAVLAAATWFLLKNMTKQFRKVDFEEEPEEPEEPLADDAAERKHEDSRRG